MATKCSICGTSDVPIPIHDGHCNKCHRELSRKYHAGHKHEILARKREYSRRVRLEVMTQYCGGEPKCACCGERVFEFLTLDHKNGDGAEHRRELKTKNTEALCRWAKAHGYPPTLQVLCWNCNCGRRVNGGVCPHKGEEQHHGTQGKHAVQGTQA